MAGAAVALYNERMPAPSPHIAVVVLAWNGRDLTLDCLRSLAAVKTGNLHILLVDNGSSDDTVGAVRALGDTRVSVLENGANLGYAAGNNAGIRQALSDGADYILLLNNDTLVDPLFVDELLAAMNTDAAVGIAAPKIYFSDPRDQIWFAGGEVHLWRGTARHTGIREMDRGQYDTPHDIDYASGCALFARRAVFERAGLLDPAYQAYFEDTDLCLRARNAGFRIRFVPTAHVWHRISASTGGQLSARKVRRKLASTRRFFCTHARPWHWLTIPLFFALDVVRIGLLVLAGRIRNTGPRTTHPAS